MCLLLFLVMQFGYQRSFTVSYSAYDAMLRRLFFDANVFSCVSSVRMMFKLSEIVCTLCIDRVFVLVYDVVSCCFLGVGALPLC
ncbi:hypothetical protein HanXRQr2_Chr16g0756211 [Helianthus annuus]|uniref:Uncharacterized protein n=1 Tax=Helianthus annuus TaxID=4232 RepID=A0A9K3GZB2_HELAN|nr:hypothetical protein HanXRQr2_Chr16g0756211 [Helianthus annuus]KAJ0641441.1 hypothetical protein HanLR1_Chr16g0627241 [Helianthus annuus]